MKDRLMGANRKRFMNTTGLPTDVVSFKDFYNGVIPDYQQGMDKE